MATVTFEASPLTNCTLQLIFPSGGGVLNITSTFSFPWTFDPLLYGRGTDELNGTYLFNCDGCDYTILVSNYIITPTPTQILSPTPTPTPTSTPLVLPILRLGTVAGCVNNEVLVPITFENSQNLSITSLSFAVDIPWNIGFTMSCITPSTCWQSTLLATTNHMEFPSQYFTDSTPRRQWRLGYSSLSTLSIPSTSHIIGYIKLKAYQQGNFPIRWGSNSIGQNQIVSQSGNIIPFSFLDGTFSCSCV